MEELTVANLRVLKGDIEEAYGKDVFENHIFKDVVNFINGDDEILKSEPSKETCEPIGNKEYIKKESLDQMNMTDRASFRIE